MRITNMDVLGLLSSLLEEFNSFTKGEIVSQSEYSLEEDEIDSFESFLSLKGFSSEAITFLTSHVDEEGNIDVIALLCP